jgi:hypothetical protein
MQYNDNGGLLMLLGFKGHRNIIIIQNFMLNGEVA